jgi:tyrosine-protein kinase Etk/Wzc
MAKIYISRAIMNTQPEFTQPTLHNVDNAQQVDILAYLGAILDKKYVVILNTIITTVLGVVYTTFLTPIYQVDSILQVDPTMGAISGFSSFGGMASSNMDSSAEIALLKSRSVIGEAVDTLNLDVFVGPKLYPYVGEYFFRNYKPTIANALAEPKYQADTYAWGGESIQVSKFKSPAATVGQTHYIECVGPEKLRLKDANQQLILEGNIGELLAQDDYSLFVSAINCRVGGEFLVSRQNRLHTILGLQNSIMASVQDQTGIITLSMFTSNISHAKAVLNELASIYVERNVARNSAEVQKSLDFLDQQLPVIKMQLEAAENTFNQYKIEQRLIDIAAETQSVLGRSVAVEVQLQDLEFQRVELHRRFKNDHPLYQALLEKIARAYALQKTILQDVKDLPLIQQRLLSLTRDVAVSNKIYMLLLTKEQELNIVLAGTTGSVIVIDTAEVNTTSPVKPNKSLIVLIAGFIGALLSIAIIFIQNIMHRGVEDPTDIEKMGMPVYATIPFSQKHSKREAKNKDGKTTTILAVSDPAENSIEAIRSLRTSLHFVMMGAKNNAIALSGPTPNVGKTFVSVNLATALAQSGKKVLLIDADMRRGLVHQQFNLKNEFGLSDYLSGTMDLEPLVHTSLVSNLNVLTRGSVPSNPSELLMHDNFGDLIENVTAAYDIVIIDTPPILAVTDPAIVSAHCGTSLLVVRFGESRLKEIELCRNRFEQNGTKIRGVVFNALRKKASNAYGHYGYYNYDYKS